MKLIYFIFIAYLLTGNNISAQTSWTRKADFPTPRYKAVAFSIGTKGYTGTGSTPDSTMNDFWEYDPISDTWQQKASLPGLGIVGAIGFSINNKGYIGGGINDTLAFAHDFWEYDPQNNVWIRKADLPIAYGTQTSMVSFSMGGKGYVRNGYDSDDFWDMIL